MADLNVADIAGQVVEKYGAAGVAFYFIFAYMKNEMNRVNDRLDSLISLCNKSFGIMMTMAKDKLPGGGKGGNDD
jgi:hypothetical protein